jgi:anti-sigma factor RsiW
MWSEDGSAENADCSMFLEDHSAYLDECLSDEEAARHEAHAAGCASCARYARVLGRGLTLVRELPELEASAHFEERLRHRIFHVEDEASRSRSGGRSIVGIAAVAAIALIAWSPLVWRTFAPSAGAARTASADASFTGDRQHDWYALPVSVDLDQMPVNRLAGYAGTYSPLIVSPPASAPPRAVRLVSATSQ